MITERDLVSSLNLFPLYQLSCNNFAMSCSTMFIFGFQYNKRITYTNLLNTSCVICFCRNLPDNEVAGVSKFLENLLNCNFDNLPTEFLTHVDWISLSRFVEVRRVYTDCLLANFKNNYSSCALEISNFCGPRFGDQTAERLHHCNTLLSQPEQTVNLDRVGDADKVVHTYRNCMKTLRNNIKSICQPSMQKACQSRNLRVTKLVRASMRSMETLLGKFPNLRVIHLMRDPRPVALSRASFVVGVRGVNAGNGNLDVVLESEMYCSTVLEDIENDTGWKCCTPVNSSRLFMRSLLDHPSY